MVRCWSIPLILFSVFLSLSAFAGSSTPAPSGDDGSNDFEHELSGSSYSYAIGLYDLYGTSHQGGRSFTTADSVQYQTSAYDGKMTEPGVFFDYQYSETWAARFFIGFQTSQQRGTATQVGIPVPSQSVELEESLIAAGGEVKYFPVHDLGLWMALGLEYDHATSVSLSLGGISLPTFSEDNPNLIQVLATLGFDLKVLNNWLIAPELRISDAVSSKPSILSYQGAVGLARLF